MSRVGLVLSFDRTTTEEGARVSLTKVDPGGDDAVMVEHYADPGDDSCPLPGDYAALEDSAGSGGEQTAGYMDVDSAPVAGPGEKRIYSRSGPGTMAAQIWLKADGSIVVSNGSGSIEMGADGDVTITGNLLVNGEVSAKAATPATKVSLSTHLHPHPMGPTSAPTPGT